MEPVKRKKKNKCKNHEECTYYDDKTSRVIQAIYIIAVILWSMLIFILDLLEADIIIWIFLFIPIIVYGINFVNIDSFECESEEDMFQGNFLTFGFLITLILLNWNSPLDSADKFKFFVLLVVAFILLMISLIDVWVDKKSMSIVKHIKTVLHTSALVLLALSLYLYYKFYRRSVSMY